MATKSTARAGKSTAATPAANQYQASKSNKIREYTSEGVKNNDITTLGSSDWELLGVLTLVGMFVRLFRIYQPTSVVFDEVQYVCQMSMMNRWNPR